jgi:3-alpha domain-containing YiiM-like protein
MTIAEVNALLYSSNHPRDRLERASRIKALSSDGTGHFRHCCRTKRPPPGAATRSRRYPPCGRRRGGRTHFRKAGEAPRARTTHGQNLAEPASARRGPEEAMRGPAAASVRVRPNTRPPMRREIDAGRHPCRHQSESSQTKIGLPRLAQRGSAGLGAIRQWVTALRRSSAPEAASRNARCGRTRFCDDIPKRPAIAREKNYSGTFVDSPLVFFMSPSAFSFA